MQSPRENLLCSGLSSDLYIIKLVVVVRLVCAKTFDLTLYLGNLTRLCKTFAVFHDALYADTSCVVSSGGEVTILYRYDYDRGNHIGVVEASTGITTPIPRCKILYY